MAPIQFATSAAGTEHMRELFAAANSLNPYRMLASDYLPGNVTAGGNTASSSASELTGGTQSQSQMAEAVGETLAQFGVNLPNDPQPATLNGFYIVQFVGSMFQILSEKAPDPSSSSSKQMLSAYAQNLRELAAAVQAQLKTDACGSDSTASQLTPIGTLISEFQRVLSDGSKGQSLVNFLRALSAKVNNGTSGDATGVFVQTHA